MVATKVTLSGVSCSVGLRQFCKFPINTAFSYICLCID